MCCCLRGYSQRQAEHGVAEPCILLHRLCIKLGRRCEAVPQNPAPAQASDLAEAVGSRNCIVCHGMEMTGLPQATARGFSAHSLCFSCLIAQWDAVAQACPQTNVVARKMENSSAQALELDSKAAAALATHRHEEGDSLLSKLFYSSVGNARKHR